MSKEELAAEVIRVDRELDNLITAIEEGDLFYSYEVLTALSHAQECMDRAWRLVND